MIKYLKTETLDDLIKEGKFIVDFYADWCSPCKMLSKVLEEIDFIDIIKVNVDERPDLAAKFGVMSIPTICYFENGKLSKKEIGYRSLEEIKTMLK